MTTTDSDTGPIPTDDADAARADLDRHGCAILAGVLDGAAVKEVRERLLAAARASEARGVPTRGYAFDPDEHNQRVFNLIDLDPLFVDLVSRPIALDFVRHLLGDSFLLSNFSANITAPGSQPMQLHADQGYVLPPWPARPLACNVAWILDDFTVENGGTRYVPGSHLTGHGPDPRRSYASDPVPAPAGSLLVMDGRLWHQTGANTSRDQTRAALFGYYVLRWLRPQVNWNVSLSPETVATLSPAFLDMLGYYTGNTEYQINTARNGTGSAPATRPARSGDFALGNRMDADRDA